MRTVIVAAVGSNGVIGIDDRLPWSIPEDLARFKRITMGGALVMGRATFESIGRPLPGRTNIVLTRNEAWSHEGVEVAGSLDAALEIARARGQDAFVIGGAEVYQTALDVADILELTEVDAAPEGDTWFPAVDWSEWRETARESREGFSFVTYERA
ncbi:MAG: dihydrofolate reductase [Actinomycetota bacterium]